tara:strand:+ start:329 stop:1972 length:1644 start_codon:yes stop_codon:yes gene_type:complete
MRDIFSDRRLTISTLLQIEDKSRQLVPMRLNPIQDDVIATSKYRDIYVKPSQVGFTSLTVGDFYIDNITKSGTVSVIISYDETSAKRQILKAKRFHNTLLRKIPSIPKLDHKSATELSWEDEDTNFYSTMYIFSARSYVLGRGEAIHNLLMDEYGFWPEGSHEEVWASAVQRVPLDISTKIRIGSTPNGEDNPFHDIYKKAKEREAVNKAIFKPHFYPWFIHPEYTMDMDSEFALEEDAVAVLKSIDEEEVRFLERVIDEYGFPEEEALDKLRWRRYKKFESESLNRSGEKLLIFEQEFPEDDESCFISAGGQAYNSSVIVNMLGLCKAPEREKSIVNPDNGLAATLDIWRDVEEGLGYIASIDPGKGKISESVGHVWTFAEEYQTDEGVDIPPMLKHCATLAGLYDEWEMAEYMKIVAYYFNGAVICPEDNLDIVSHLRDYPNLYWREDTRTGRVMRSIGWQSNVATKPFMITEVSRLLEYIDCLDRRFWVQCRNIRRDASVKSGIVVVGADDHHDAGAIGIVCRSAMPIQRGYIGSYGWDDSWGR